MAENWMKKLIELFKYYVDNYWTDTKNTEKEYWIIDYWRWFQYWTREYLYETIISKKFLFIDWLVKEDKIDFYKVSQAENELEVDVNVYKSSYEDDNYYWLIMILAIQDEPIEFLISILK